jgi:hypothetical protein
MRAHRQMKRRTTRSTPGCGIRPARRGHVTSAGLASVVLVAAATIVVLVTRHDARPNLADPVAGGTQSGRSGAPAGLGSASGSGASGSGASAGGGSAGGRDPSAASGDARGDGSAPSSGRAEPSPTNARPPAGQPAGVRVVAGRAVPVSAGTGSPPEKDVSISRCGTLASTSWPQAGGSVVNTSTFRADYWVSVGFYGPAGTAVGSASTSLDGLAAGGVSAWQVTVAQPRPFAVTCRVLAVSRTPSY